MRIYIITDMEGVAGVVNFRDYVSPNSRYYDIAKELTTLEVNAAIEGAIEAGATEFLVADGHGPGAIDIRYLHPKAKLLTGRPSGYPFGCDNSFDAAFIIGQHAMANVNGGHLCHTGDIGTEAIFINGHLVGELGCNALMAGYYGVPIVMVSGDLAACKEAEELIPGIAVAAVKEGLKKGHMVGMTAKECEHLNGGAIHLVPEVARALIRETAKKSLSLVGKIPPLRFDSPYEMKIIERREIKDGPWKVITGRSNDMIELLKMPKDWEYDMHASRFLEEIIKKQQ